MAALSFKKKSFQKKKGKEVFSKAKEYKATSKRTPTKKPNFSKKTKVEIPATAENSALKLTGLTFTVTDEAIRQFFKEHGVKIEKLHRCDTDTWKSGMAYATVSSTDLLQKGLKVNKKELEGRYVSVVIKRQAEMESVLECVTVLDTVVRLRGLPYDSKKEDIVEFFKGLPIPKNGIYLKKGDAYVRFNDAATAKKALKKNDCYIGQRYVKVYICKLPQLTELKYIIIKNQREGHEVLKKFLGSSLNASGRTQPPKKKSILKSGNKIKMEEPDEESPNSDEEMQEEADSSEEEDNDISFEDAIDEPMEEGIGKGQVKIFQGTKKIDLSQGVLDFLGESSEDCSSDSESSFPVTTPKKQKKAKGSSMKADLSSKGFEVKTDNAMFTEIVKKPGSAVRKSGGVKRTSMVKSKDSEDESIPQLVTVTPKLKGTPASHKTLSTGKKGKRRSMFTATPK